MIGNILTNPVIYNITQTTQAQVGIETGLKAIGRPGFIILDNSIDKNTKKYSATKELLYQLTCLVASIAVIIPVFKKSSFAIARKFFKNEPILKAFKNSDEFNQFYKQNSKENRVPKLREIYPNSSKYTDEQLQDQIHLAKGIIETTSIAGSILGLSIVAPLLSRPLIRPVLRKLGLDEKNNTNTNNQNPSKVDTKA